MAQRQIASLPPGFILDDPSANLPPGFVIDNPVAAPAAKPQMGKPSDPWRDLSAGQLADAIRQESTLSAMEGVGIDPQSPIVGSLKNALVGAGNLVNMSDPLKAAEAWKNLALTPVRLAKHIASGGSSLLEQETERQYPG